MNFNFGEIFAQAWQITWKNKVLWVITVLPLLISFLFMPVWLAMVFTQDMDPSRMMRFMENQTYMVLISILYFGVLAGSVFLQILSRASVTLGVYRIEAEGQPVALLGLLKEGLRYFWRFLGILLLLAAGMIAVFLVFSLCMGILSVATMGLGALCIQPFFLLMFPLIFLLMAFMEQSEAATVADGMGVIDSMKRGFELLKAHIWKYLLVTFVIYFGMNILSGIVMIPLMMPMFFSMMNNFEGSMDFNSMFKMQAVIGMIALPLMTLLQGFLLTYLKSAMMVMYLRLTRSTSESQAVLQMATV